MQPSLNLPFFLMLPLVVSVLLPGCSTGPVLQSQTVGKHSMDKLNYVADYRLAKVLLPVTLKKSGDSTYSVEIAAPIYTGDPSGAYLIHYDASASSKDDFTVEVDENTRLLKKINIKTEDKADEIAVQLVKGVSGLLESAPAPEPKELALISYQLDPADPKQVDELKKDLINVSKENIKNFEITSVDSANTVQASMPAPDCSVGFCYRLPVSYCITITFSNEITYSKEIMLPNGGPVVAVPLTRAAYVEKITNIQFANGSPNSITITKPSEALEFAAILLDIAKAIIQVPAEILKLRVDLSSQEAMLAGKKKEQLEKEKALKDYRDELAKKESAPTSGRQVFMFATNGTWSNAVGNLQHSQGIPASGNSDGGHGQIESIGGNPGNG